MPALADELARLVRPFHFNLSGVRELIGVPTPVRQRNRDFLTPEKATLSTYIRYV